MKEYIYSIAIDGKHTVQNPEDAPMPTDFNAAVQFYNAIEAYHGHTPIRVMELDHDAMTFRDVSELIINELYERETEHRRMIMIDAAHDRSETFGWDQV